MFIHATIVVMHIDPPEAESILEYDHVEEVLQEPL
jgi:hypothetical protein